MHGVVYSSMDNSRPADKSEILSRRFSKISSYTGAAFAPVLDVLGRPVR
jgi:hypothetical protein